MRVWPFWWENFLMEQKRKQDYKVRLHNRLLLTLIQIIDSLTCTSEHLSVCFVVLSMRRCCQRLWLPGFIINLDKVRPHKGVRIVKIRAACGTFRFSFIDWMAKRMCVGKSWSYRKSDSKSGWSQYEFIGFTDVTQSGLKTGFLHLVQFRWSSISSRCSGLCNFLNIPNTAWL